MFIAGDIGGTKTILSLYEMTDQVWQGGRKISFESGTYHALEAMLKDLIAGAGGTPTVLCLGVAGPVVAGQSEVTNLGWMLDERELSRVTGIPKVKLLNDLHAMSLGLLHLPDASFVDLNPEGIRQSGNRAVLAAGTGLGESILYWDGHRYHALATEGGHTDFAPNNEQEDKLLAYLRDKYQGHVSYERILSGSGLINIYEYLRDSGFAEESDSFRAYVATNDDIASAISHCALFTGDRLCMEALRMFVSIYGAEAGNLVLKCFATGGVMIGGGIAPKILSAMTSDVFMDSFCAKGRFADFMRKTSVRVATDTDTVLLGAASWAEAWLRSSEGTAVR